MIPRVEFGNLHKFIASSGLLLLVAAFVVPWLFVQSTGVLLVDAEELATLTPIAHETLAGRQEAIAEVQRWMPMVALALFLSGFGLLWWGLNRWRAGQQLQDRGDAADVSRKENEARKSRAEVEPLPQSEAEAKLAAEVDESIGIDLASPDTSGISEPRASGFHPPATDRDVRIAKLRDYEMSVFELLAAAYVGAFAVSENVRLTTGRAVGVTFDAFLDPLPDTPWAQLAVDVRVVASRFPEFRVFDWVMRLAVATHDLAAGSVYTAGRGRPREAAAPAVLVFIVESQDGDVQARVSSLSNRIDSMNSVLRRPIGVVLVSSERIGDLTPSALRDSIASVWSGAAGHVVAYI